MVAGIAIEVIAGAATYDLVIIGEAVISVVSAAYDVVVAGMAIVTSGNQPQPH